MSSFTFTGKIVGGPHDGYLMSFSGECEGDPSHIFSNMDVMEAEGHKYKIVEFDKEKLHAVLMW